MITIVSSTCPLLSAPRTNLHRLRLASLHPVQCLSPRPSATVMLHYSDRSPFFGPECPPHFTKSPLRPELTPSTPRPTTCYPPSVPLHRRPHTEDSDGGVGGGGCGGGGGGGGSGGGGGGTDSLRGPPPPARQQRSAGTTQHRS